MDNLKEFLAPFAKDRAVWVMVATLVVGAVNRHFNWGFNDDWVSATAAGFATWIATHVVHVNTVGKSEETKG